MSEFTTKECNKCHKVLPITEFDRQPNSPDGLKYSCKACQSVRFKAYYQANLQTQRARDKERYPSEREMRSNAHYKRKYGLSLKEYQALLKQQNGVCAICLQAEHIIWHGQLRPLSVDHCHNTGQVRGLLCSDCNTMLGHVNDNVETLQRAIDYLKG